MYGTSEFEVTAQADCQIFQSAKSAADGHQVGKGLGRMLMSAVTGIDDGNAGIHGGTQGSTFLWMAHSTDVCITADNADGIGNTFTFGCRTGIRAGKTEDTSAEVEHGSFKTQSGTGTGLVEKGSEFFVAAYLPIT